MSTRARSATRIPATGRRRLFRLRPQVWAGLVLLVVLGIGGHAAWQRYAPVVARHPQYQLTAESIHITPPPPWIRSDVKSEVLRDAGLVGTVSVLGDWDQFCRRIKDAFDLHPWVASVVQIRKRLPAALEVEVEYRKPTAAVESSDTAGVTFLPIDAHAIRLPETDLTDVERRYLPRISGVTGRPLVGDAWDDPRIVGGAKLAAALADVWQQLRLVEIIATHRPQTAEEPRGYLFEIITSGGTRIVWGAPPGQESLAGESAWNQKRQRLLDYAAQDKQLDSIDGPATVDVRRDLVVTPRKPADSNGETDSAGGAARR